MCFLNGDIQKLKWFRDDSSKGNPRHVAEDVLVLRFQAVVLQIELPSESPVGPTTAQVTGPHPWSFYFSRIDVRMRNCNSNKFQNDTDISGTGTAL